MKKINKQVFISFDEKEYNTKEECKIADINEMLRRFVINEGYYSPMSKSDFGDMLIEHKDTLHKILNGEAVYQTDEEGV